MTISESGDQCTTAPPPPRVFLVILLRILLLLLLILFHTAFSPSPPASVNVASSTTSITPPVWLEKSTLAPYARRRCL